MVIVFAIIFFGVIIYLYKKSEEQPVASLANWRMYFEELGMPAEEFFDRVKASVERTGIPDIHFSTVTYRQEGIFSASREYFRISRNEYVIDICASPFGNGFFVSYWLGQTSGGILARIPVMNKLMGKDVNSKTYYQLDTEQMFKESMHACIVHVINEISDNKGIRAIGKQMASPTIEAN